MEKKKDIFTKSVFKDIILVQKIASFQSQSRVIDNKTLTSFVYTLLFRLILERINVFYKGVGCLLLFDWWVFGDTSCR